MVCTVADFSMVAGETKFDTYNEYKVLKLAPTDTSNRNQYKSSAMKRST